MKHSIVTSIVLAVTVMSAMILVSGCTTGTGAATVSAAAGTAGTADLGTGLPDHLNYTLEIVGGNRSPVTLAYADLKALGLVKKANVRYLDDAQDDAYGDFTGVPLDAILAAAGVPAGATGYNVSDSYGTGMVYTQKQADAAILCFRENYTVLTDDANSHPIHMVLSGGPMCHWVELPVRIEILGNDTNASTPGDSCASDKCSASTGG